MYLQQFSSYSNRKCKQEAQLLQRDRAMLGVIEYFASLKVIRNGILEKGVNPY